ncbi:MAG: hypothetical protein IPH35_01345 [Rhodoferax sp.]|nr:hypothetical protein [Rhodoferax sp.]
MPTHTTLLWEEPSTWAKALEDLAPEICNATSVRKLEKAKPDFLPSDDLSWAQDLLPARLRAKFDLSEELLERLTMHFTHFRAYHGGRPLVVDSYLRDGLVPLNSSKAIETVYENFADGKYPEVTREVLDRAVSSMDTEYREARVFFEGSKRLLLDSCGHYMLYGSEYIVGVLRSIPGTRDYAQVLKQRGTPTVLTCDIPMDWIQDSTLGELAGRLISTYFKLQLFEQYSHPQRGEGFGFEIFRTLAPELIISVEHPTNIHDPIANDA